MTRENRDELRKRIIGLGESSNRKNYYPELMGKIRELEKINARNDAMLKAIPDLLILRDQQGRYYEYYGEQIDLETPIKSSEKRMVVEALFDSEWADRIEAAITEVETHGNVETFDFEIESFCFELRIVPTDKGEILLIIRDVTELRAFYDKLEYMATRDYLTDLYNRSYFEREVQRLVESGEDNVGIMLFDIDGLKLINDAFGHLAGDKMITTFSDAVKGYFRGRGVIGRLGGDEFGVIISHVNEKILDRMTHDLEMRFGHLYTPEQKIKISVSMGYAMFSEQLNEMHLVMASADQMMYRKKLLKSGSVRNEIVTAMMSALEARDYITEGHAERIENVALFIGEKLELPRHQLGSIQLLAKFHDFGKVGIPDSILMKPGPLTDEEMTIMKTHCEIGQRIASASTELAHIANLILMHHERWDGSGYPLGLKGEEIPIECRILSIADAYDAMTNDRPYRKALPREAVLAELIKFRGIQFDPELTDLFFDYLEEIEAIRAIK